MLCFFVLGAILSATDAVAAIGITKGLVYPQTLQYWKIKFVMMLPFVAYHLLLRRLRCCICFLESIEPYVCAWRRFFNWALMLVNGIKMRRSNDMFIIA